MHKDELPTPVLWLDLDVFESNVAYLARYFRDACVAWRPQTKAIRWPGLVRKLLDAGAAGVTCASLEDAERLAAAGIDDILLARPPAGPMQAKRIGELAGRCRLTITLDSAESAALIGATLEDPANRKSKIQNRKLATLIEIDLGLRRCGVAPEQAVALAKHIATVPGLDFRGLMAWEGHVLSIADPAARREACIAAVQTLVRTADAIRAAGLACPVVNCGGSGTFRITSHVAGVTEIQAGGAALGDLQYDAWGTGLPPALHLTATIISTAVPGRAVIDMGYKRGGGGAMLPQPKNHPGLRTIALHAEHGLLEVAPGTPPPPVGSRLDLTAGYSDQTTHLYNRLYALRRGQVEAVFDL
jgi:D-serine deaminase-like pyridoxal phosphate-dependent protein